MGVLIDDLLQLSRVTRGEMEQTQVDLSAIAERLAGRLRERHANRTIRFAIEPGLTARGDAVQSLTRLFEEARFSRHEIDAAMKRDAIGALRAIRDDLQGAAA